MMKSCALFIAIFAMSGQVAPKFSTTKTPLENFAVRTDANQPQCQFVGLFVDEKQVRLEMALVMVGIFARQRMTREISPAWAGPSPGTRGQQVDRHRAWHDAALWLRACNLS
jgi:hypothetical protein